MRASAAASITLFLCSAAVAAGARAAPAAAAQEDGQWSMPAKDYASTRYSALTDDQRRATPPRLHPVWTFSTGVLGGHEGQPLVVGDTMYVVTPWPNVLYAFDLTKEGYPLRWKYRPDVSANAIGVSCCDTVNRGAAYADGKIVYNLLDGHTVALDAKTGHELWNTQVADVASGETVTMAPLVVKDRVIVGASGGEFGIYGWIKGLDLKTGSVVWTGHNIGPDAGMLAKPGDFNAPYDSGADLGARSWPGETWRTGGAPVWGWVSYDPELDLVYYGTGNAATVQRRTASRGQQVDRERARAPPRRWHAGVGLPVHAARQLGLRCDRRDGACGPDRRRQAGEGAGALRQERLRVHAGSRHRQAAARRAVRQGQLGEVDRPGNRSPGDSIRQADRRLQGQR